MIALALVLGCSQDAPEPPPAAPEPAVHEVPEPDWVEVRKTPAWRLDNSNVSKMRVRAKVGAEWDGMLAFFARSASKPHVLTDDMAVWWAWPEGEDCKRLVLTKREGKVHTATLGPGNCPPKP